MKQWLKISIGLVVIVFFLVVLTSIFSGPSENTFNTTIITSNIAAQDINKTESGGVYKLHGTLQNTGNTVIPYVAISVNDSSGNVDQSYIIDIKPGEKKEFNIELPDAEEYDDYKIIIGDQNYQYSESDIQKIIDPVISSNKGSGTSGIIVKGQSYIFGDTYSSSGLTTITSKDTATFFVVTNTGNQFVNKWRYVDTGKVVSGYKQYADITVISWPDMKVIGQNRVYGSRPPSETYGGGGDIYGSEPDIDAWINSLPKG